MQFVKKEYNEWTGAVESYYWDDVTETMTIKNTFDVSSVIESNKRLKNSKIDSRFGSGMMHHMAEIPNAFIMKFKKEHGLDVFSNDPSDQRKLRRLLESPEYSFLKTHTKKLWRPVSKKKATGVSNG